MIFRGALGRMREAARQNYHNARGWRTSRKIVVFESDDWGSIRIPDQHALRSLKAEGIDVDRCAYMLNDCLEANEDLELLFDLLEHRKKRVVLTANFLTANPDFEKIEQSGFSEYYYERVEETLNAHWGRDRVKQLWLDGLRHGIFFPQLHGREHLNIANWLDDLRSGNKETLAAFRLKTFGVSAHVVRIPRLSYQAAFGLTGSKRKNDVEQIVNDAAGHFEDLFGFKSKTFIAPNYTWNAETERALKKVGIGHLQGASVQRVPDHDAKTQTNKRNFMGHTNDLGQKYLVRNAEFEPFSDLRKDWVGHCMRAIQNAFLWGKPAIVSMHRVNFVGGIRPENRERNLQLFQTLLNQIDKRWPEVEYLSTDELAKLV